MRLSWIVVATCLCLCLGRPAVAAELEVRVRDAQGAPVSDAVVTLADGDAVARTPPPAPPAATHVVDQRDESFVPYVTVLRPGDSVVFRNSDTTRHHVYSFSPIKSFEQLLSPGDSGVPLRIDRPGEIAVGCNIHDHMRAWLVVTTAARVAVTDAHGVAHFPALAAGVYMSLVWHPQLRPRQPPPVQAVSLPAADAKRVLGISLRLLPDPRGTDPHRQHY
jgi:plastocyanin